MRISDWSSDVCSSDLACHVLKRATARNWAIERKARHVIAKRLTFFHRPMLDDVPSGIKRCVVIEEAYPERGQGADAAPRAAIRAAHPKKRSEERRVGTECVSTCRSRGSP